ncbi:MAG: hypothetical protein CVU77_02945 [Elusimicrobia bacterium HGW-Elusimicrobia-1]|jgi:heptosyltransferase-2|nr:MAG: hypothetical protein CVU77_02945 [Elusimicrobia bacterium HGW-Elusimicrobia-1]
MANNGTFNNILVRGVDTVGTFVLATPFYRALRRNYPSSKIVLCIKPLVRELAANCPYMDEVIIYDKKKYGGEFGFIRELRSRQFDAAFVLSGSFHSALICYLAGIKNTIGYPHDRRGFLLTHKIPDNNKHCVEYLLNIIEQLGGAVESREPELWFSDDDFSKGSQILKAAGLNRDDKIIGIGFGAAGESARRWPTENWTGLIRNIIEDKRVKVVLFGTKKDLEESAVIERGVADGRLINLINRTNTVKLAEFAACVKGCAAYVSVDTGGIHVAAALGVPVVGLYVPGSDDRWGARTLKGGPAPSLISKKTPCAPCDQSKMRRCRDNICMRAITAEDVGRALIGVPPAPPSVR